MDQAAQRCKRRKSREFIYMSIITEGRTNDLNYEIFGFRLGLLAIHPLSLAALGPSEPPVPTEVVECW